MSHLAQLQTSFADALLGRAVFTSNLILSDGLSPEVRMDVHRNNVMTSLTRLLEDCFPVTRMVLDPRFFGFAAREFIRAYPPRDPRLVAYGEAFPRFLATFLPAQHLHYLPDLAQLEWLLHRSANAALAVPKAASEFFAIAPGVLGELILTIAPSMGVLWSSWPVQKLWTAHQCEAGEVPLIDLAVGETFLEVLRSGTDVGFRVLNEDVFEFRLLLLGGATIDQAADRASAINPRFDLASEFSALLREGLIVDFSIRHGAAEP